MNHLNDGGQRDSLRLFGEFLRRCLLEMQTSGPLNLAIIQGPKTNVWYAKSRMGEHKIGSIVETLAKSLNVHEKRISDHSTTNCDVTTTEESRTTEA